MLQKVLRLQQELQAPKNLVNNFGGYNYRSAEGILEALKPHLEELGLIIRLNDKLVHIGERYYIEATATLIDVVTKETHEATGYAREEETKKGMDGSQITGASSSYARKYALNGLLAIDDVKDSDTTNTEEVKATEKQAQFIQNLYNDEEIAKMLGRLKKKELSELTVDEASKMIKARQK